jgi:hypothetical protein
VNVTAPLVDREHEHIHNHRGAQLPESWNFTGLGDVRVLGRYNLSHAEMRESHEHSFAGISFGLKLPTGAFDVRNGAGELAERTLQPGTGTTDALLGAHYMRALPMRDLSWFVQAQLQAPLNSREGYKPGSRLTADAGLRHDLADRVSLLLQANLLRAGPRFRHQCRARGQRRALPFPQPRCQRLGHERHANLRISAAAAVPVCERVQLTATRRA